MALLAVFTLLFVGPSIADTRKGIAAYQRGDYESAMRELEAAAAAGDAQAIYNLGVAYAEGKAVPQDLAKALSLYLKAADGGSVLGAFNLAQAYRKGIGTDVNDEQAARWYTFGAKRGDYRAGNELGLLYVEGKGVAKDLIEGFAWIYPATHASIMDLSAIANAVHLAKMLTKDQLQIAQARGQFYYKQYIAPHERLVRTLRGG